MRLIENWRAIAARSHSMWAFYLSALCLIAPDAIYLLAGVDTSPRLWWCLALALLIYGIVGRVKDQGIDRTTLRSPVWAVVLAVVVAIAAVSFGDWRGRTASVSPPPVEQADTMPASEPAFVAAAVPFVGAWEGLRLEAYRDIVGVWTICFGETEGVRPGEVRTEAECEALFAKRLLQFRRGLHGHLTIETLHERLPLPRDVAFASFAYNVGISGAGGSTAVRRLNDGDIAGACDALTWWNKAGGRVIRGLVRRRTEERSLCLEGMA